MRVDSLDYIVTSLNSKAAELIESMDETVDPCDDFYQFACGGWMKKNILPRGYGATSQFRILDGRIKHYTRFLR